MTLLKSICKRENCTCETLLDVSNKELDILIVGGSPGLEDVKSGKPFTGKRGNVLRRCLTELKKKYTFSYGIVNTVRKRGKELEYCIKALKEDIKLLNPKIIVALGKSTYSIFNDAQYYKDHFIMEEGCVRELDVFGEKRSVIASIHPKWCFENDPCSVGFLYVALQKAILHTQGISFNISNDFEYKIIETVSELEEMLEKMKNSKKKVGVDTETTSLNRVYDQTVLSIQFCNDGKTGYVLPYKHFDSPFSNKEIKKINKLLIDFFTGPSKVTGYIFQNAKFDMHQLFRELHILMYNAPIIDTMFNEYILEENWSRVTGYFPKGSGPYSLSTLSYKRGFTCYVTQAEMSKSKRNNLKEIPIKDFARYAAADAIVVWNIYKKQLLLAKCCDYEKQFKKMALVFNTHITRVLVYIEHCGMPINIDVLRDLSNPRTSELIKKIKEVDTKFREMESVKKLENILIKQETGSSTTLFGKPDLFDIQKKSHQELLFTRILKLDPLNEAGKTSVNDEFQKVYKDVPEVKLLTQWNKLGKLKSSYIDNLMISMSKENGESDFFTDLRVRASFMFDAVTGRLKARAPNVQQRPSHGDNIAFVLSLYEATYNKMLVKLDQSTFEVRGLGFISHDKSLCNSFIEMHDLKMKWRNDISIMPKETLKNLTDSHKRNASVFFNTSIDKVTPEMRQDTKGFVFGCFTGDTIVSTEEGPIRIRKLIGKNIKVVTQNGVFSSEGSEFMGKKLSISVLTDRSHLKGTSGHWIMTVTDYKLEMKPLGSLKIGDTVLYQKGVFGNIVPKRMGKELSLLEVEELGYRIADKNCINKVLSSSKEYVSAYLRGLFKHAKTEEHQISLSSFNCDLLYDLCYLLNLFDIDSCVYDNLSFELIILKHSIPMFEREILLKNIAIPIINSKSEAYTKLRETYNNKAGLLTFNSTVTYYKNVYIPPLPEEIFPITACYKDAFTVLDLKEEYEFLLLLSNVKISKVIRGPINLGIKKVFDVINVEKIHTWSANGVIVHNTMYGMGDASIAANLGKTMDQAKAIKALFFKNMPIAAKWLFDYIINFAKKNLYVESPIGRRRRLWGHLLPKGAATSKMDRLSMNSIIQGVCSDLNIIATSLLIEKIYKWGIGKYQVPDEEAFMVINLVHDSCEMEVPKSFFKKAYKVENLFTNGVSEYVEEKFDFKIDIPLEIDMEIGKSFDKMNKWDGSKESLKLIKEKMREI